MVFGDNLVSLNMASWKKAHTIKHTEEDDTPSGDYILHNAEVYSENEKVKFHSAEGVELEYRSVFPNFFE